MTVPPLTRRSLLAGCVIAAGGAVAGFAVARGSDAGKATSPGSAANGYGAPSSAKVLAPLAAVTGDGIVAHGVVLTRGAGGAVSAVSATCTHQGCTVGAPHGGIVTCPCHGSEFVASSGAVRRGPATRPLPPVRVHVEAGNIVTG